MGASTSSQRTTGSMRSENRKSSLAGLYRNSRAGAARLRRVGGVDDKAQALAAGPMRRFSSRQARGGIEERGAELLPDLAGVGASRQQGVEVWRR